MCNPRVVGVDHREEGERVTKPHPNLMTVWPEIACTRGHTSHATRTVQVTLDGPTPYHDYAPIPHRLARSFEMTIYDPDVHPVDGLSYCPAADAVSETIVSHGVWEPRETVLALTVCDSAAPNQIMVDFGCQIGWFSLLAASCGVDVLAYDADMENLRVLMATQRAGDWPATIRGCHLRVGPGTEPFPADHPIRLAKIDVEGAEDEVVRVLWPSIEAGLVDHMLIEVSPVFADYYGDLVCQIIDAGYDAYALPPKFQPPVTLDDPERDLALFRLSGLGDLRGLVNSWHQENFWFTRRGASW